MLIESIARRYAKALFDAALAQRSLDTVKHEINEFVKTLSKDEQLGALWYSTRIPGEEKKALLRKFFPGLSTLVFYFLFVLVDKHREKIIEKSVVEYERFLLEFYNQVFVDVESASPVPESIQTDLKERLSQKLGKRVELNLQQDPLLLGGMVIRIGDHILDGSLRTKLQGLREELLKN